MTQWGLDTLFNPAKRHMDEEKRRLQATRQQVGDTSGGKRIDLESGKVRIGRTGRDAEDQQTDAEQASPADETDTGAPKADEATATKARADKPKAGNGKPDKPKAGNAKADKPAPSPAQIRAAQRRGRTPR